MVDPELLTMAELAIGLKVGEPTVTHLSVTGEPYVTMTNGGIKAEGMPYPRYETIKALAIEQYIRSCEDYRYNQENKAGRPCVLYWRRHPKLLHRGKKGYVVTSRMLISAKPPLDEREETCE